MSKLILLHFQQYVGSFCISKNSKLSSNNPPVKIPENTLFKIYMQKLFHLKLKYKIDQNSDCNLFCYYAGISQLKEKTFTKKT